MLDAFAVNFFNVRCLSIAPDLGRPNKNKTDAK